MASRKWHKNYFKTNETRLSYERFKAYLRMEKRSIETLAAELGVSRTFVGTLSSKHKWVERARAFDDWFAETLEEEMREMIREKIRIDEDELFERNINQLLDLEFASERMIENLLKILNLPIVEQKTTRKPAFGSDGKQLTDKKGELVFRENIIIKPLRYSGADVARLAEAAVVVGNYAREQLRHLTPNESPLNPMALLPPAKPLSEMSAREKLEHAENLRAISEQVAAGVPIDEIEGLIN